MKKTVLVVGGAGYIGSHMVMPRRAGDPASLVGDARRALEVLGWKPEYPELDSIIRTVWEWMENRVGLATPG